MRDRTRRSKGARLKWRPQQIGRGSSWSYCYRRGSSASDIVVIAVIAIAVAVVVSIALFSRLTYIATLFEEGATQSGAFEDSLNEVSLLQGFGQVFIHLGLYTFLAVTQHGVSGEGNDRGSLSAEATLIFTNLASGFKSTLICVSEKIQKKKERKKFKRL